MLLNDRIQEKSSIHFNMSQLLSSQGPERASKQRSPVKYCIVGIVRVKYVR